MDNLQYITTASWRAQSANISQALHAGKWIADATYAVAEVSRQTNVLPATFYTWSDKLAVQNVLKRKHQTISQVQKKLPNQYAGVTPVVNTLQ